MAAICNKSMKSELVAIYRLEFYRNKTKWKFSSERRESEKKIQATGEKSLNKTYDVETEAKANEAPPLNEAFIHKQPVDKKLFRSVLSDPGATEVDQPSSDLDNPLLHHTEQVCWEADCDTLHPDWKDEDPNICMAYDCFNQSNRQPPSKEPLNTQTDLNNIYNSHIHQYKCNNTYGSNQRQEGFENHNETKTEAHNLPNTDLLATLVAKVRQRDLYTNVKDYKSLTNSYKSRNEDYKSQINDYTPQICDYKFEVGDDRGSQAEDYKSYYGNFKPCMDNNKHNTNCKPNEVPILNENAPYGTYGSQDSPGCPQYGGYENYDLNQLLDGLRQNPRLDLKHSHYTDPIANLEPVTEKPNPKLKYPNNYNINIPDINQNLKNCEENLKFSNSETQFDSILDRNNMQVTPQYKHIVPSNFVDLVNTCLCQMGVDYLPDLENCEALGSESRDFVRGAHTAPHSSETDLTVDCPCPSKESLHVLTARQLRSALVTHLSAVRRLVAEHAHRTDLTKEPAPIKFEELDTQPTRDFAGVGRGRIARDKLHLIKIVRGRPYRL